MKTLKIFCFLMALTASIVTFNSCSKDDDPDGGKKGEAMVTLDGEAINLKYAYYTVYEGTVMLQFSNYDVTSGKYPDDVIFMLIDYPAAPGQKDIENASIESGVYSFTIERHDGPEESGNDIFYDTKYGDKSNSDLVVEKNGKNIKLSVDHLTLVRSNSNGKPTGEITGSFLFNGPIKKLSY